MKMVTLLAAGPARQTTTTPEIFLDQKVLENIIDCIESGRVSREIDRRRIGARIDENLDDVERNLSVFIPVALRTA